MSQPPTDPPTPARTIESAVSRVHPTTILRRVLDHGRSLRYLAFGLAFLCLLSAPAAAQGDVGDVYCDTGVATGIDLVFGALAGLGLPATGIYMGKAGFSFMNAGGDLEKQKTARQNLVGAGIGFGIVTLALVSPELIDKIGSQMGFGFSDCVTPF